MRRRGYPPMHGGRRGPTTTGSRQGVSPSTPGGRGGVASDGWQQWKPCTKWEPGETWSVHEEGRKTEKGETQGGAQSSKEVWINPVENEQRLQKRKRVGANREFV